MSIAAGAPRIDEHDDVGGRLLDEHEVFEHWVVDCDQDCGYRAESWRMIRRPGGALLCAWCAESLARA